MPRRPRFPLLALTLVAALAAGACHHGASGGAGNAAQQASTPEAIVQPGAPGQPSTVEASVPAFHDPAYTPEDVEFMQGMIHHHEQALQMVALIPTHTDNAQIRLLGEKIQLSQSDEIKLMKEWLTLRGQAVPMEMPDGTMTMGNTPMAPMPGMLTAAQMKALAAAHGKTFDALFLSGMIQHHGGALTMVKQLRTHAGSGLEPNVDNFLIMVVTDQQMEIDRMNGLLGRPTQ